MSGANITQTSKDDSMALNLHRLLNGTDTLDGFRQGIELSAEDDEVLVNARNDIRAEIKSRFRAVSDREPLAKAFLVEARLRPMFTDADLRKLRITPRFRMQGSYVYRTLNDPVTDHVPPQQVDLDDGVFVPTSFVNEENPTLAAKSYFDTAEDALEPLCQSRGWTLNKEKSSCVRIYIDNKIHIDLPLYAIPDKDFEQVELMTKAAGLRTAALESSVLSEEEYQAVPDDHIMLAEREGSWRKSDPRALERWFLKAIDKHGEGLRHVCRYLKAWRDYQWREPKDGIPSITLMAIAVEAFDRAASKHPSDREDRMLRMVAGSMPTALGQTIKNPVVESETLDEGWSPERRAEFVARARDLSACLAAAMDGASADAAIVRMQGSFGDRVPDQPSLVQPDAALEAAILAAPRRYVDAPAVGRSVSG